jgi:hypothetical protein
MTFRSLLVIGMGLLAGVAAAQDPPAFKSEKEKVSYALGMNLARQLRAQSIEVDPEVLSQGLRDALSRGETRLTEQEVLAIVIGIQKELKSKRAAVQSEKPGPPKDLAGISVTFKLDPRLATGIYGGERWVSPPTYTKVGEGKTVTVEARAHGLDANRRPVAVIPKWTSSDPAMVTITPGERNQVTITVQRPGESSLHVTAQDASKELAIKAAYQNNVLQVDITQK